MERKITMCECGCSSNHQKYYFAAPKNKIYLLTLVGGCTNCHYGPGISLELIDKQNYYWKYKEDFLDGELPLENWGDSSGIHILTGMEKHQFVSKLQSHLIGIDSRAYGDEKTIDKDGAEVILEEMYEDSLVTPTLIKSTTTLDHREG